MMFEFSIQTTYYHYLIMQLVFKKAHYYILIGYIFYMFLTMNVTLSES